MGKTGGAGRPRVPREQLALLHASGLKMAVIARRLGFTLRAVELACRRFGLPRRKSGGRA